MVLQVQTVPENCCLWPWGRENLYVPTEMVSQMQTTPAGSAALAATVIVSQTQTVSLPG